MYVHTSIYCTIKSLCGVVYIEPHVACLHPCFANLYFHSNSVDKETPLHCAAYNKADSGDLMNIVMKSYKECGIHLENELQRANKSGVGFSIVFR